MGTFGVLAAIAFAVFIRDPVRHPMINKAELDLIREGGGLVELDSGGRKSDNPTFTLHNVRQLLANRMMVGIYIGQYCINVLTYFFVT